MPEPLADINGSGEGGNMAELIGWGVFAFGCLILIPLVIAIIKQERKIRKG